MVENWIARIIFWLSQLFFTYLWKKFAFYYELLTQNLHVFCLITFPLIESWVTHWATLEVMLDHLTELWVASDEWATSLSTALVDMYCYHWSLIPATLGSHSLKPIMWSMLETETTFARHWHVTAQRPTFYMTVLRCMRPPESWAFPMPIGRLHE